MSATILVLDDLLGSIGGAGYVIRRYLVTDPTDADGNTCDPRLDAQLPEVGTGLPTLVGPLVKSFGLVRAYDTRHFEVEVVYETPGAVGASWGGEWQVRISGALATERTLTEIQGIKDIRAGVKPRIIGSWKYHREYIPKSQWPRETDDEGVPIPDGAKIDPNPPDAKDWGEEPYVKYTAGPHSIWLEQDENKRGRRTEGMDYGRGIAGVSLTKQTEFTIDIAALGPYQGTVNNDTFNVLSGSGRTYTFMAGTVLFDSYDATEEIGAISVGHLVTLNFTYDYRGHQYWAAHTYEDTDGTVWPVMTLNNHVVSETYTRQLTSNFGGLLGKVV